MAIVMRDRHRPRAGAASRGGALLAWAVRWSIARPVLTIALSLALAIVGIAYTASTLRFQSSSVKLLPPHQPYVQSYNAALAEFGELNDIVVAVEAPTVERAQAYADRLAVDIAALPGRGRVSARVDPDVFEGDALLYLSVDRLTELRDKILEHRAFMHAYAARPTIAGLLDAISDEIGRRFALGFVDLGLDEGAPKKFDAGFVDTLLEIVADGLAGQMAASPWTRVFEGDGADHSGYFLSADEKLLFIMVEPRREDGNFTDNEAFVGAIRRTIAALGATFPDVRAGVTGAPVLSNDEMVAAFHDSETATVLAAVLTTGILILVFRRVVEPLALLGVLGVSLAWSLGLITATVGHLSVFSVMFISLLIGIGIDYGIYVIFRYEEEIGIGRTPREALDVTARFAGPGVLFGALAAAGTFGVLTLTEFRGIQEFGVIAGIAILAAFVAMMTLLPAVLVTMRRRTLVLVHERAAETGVHGDRVPLLRRLAEYRAPILGVATAITLVSVVALPSVTFDYNRLNLQAKGTEAAIWERKIMESRRSGFPAMALAGSLGELGAKQAAFERLPGVAEVVSVLKLIPKDQEPKIALVQTFAPAVADVTFADAPRLDAGEVRAALATLRRRLEIGMTEADGATAVTLRAAHDRTVGLLATLDRAGPGAVERMLRPLDAALRDDFVAKVGRLQDNLAPRPLTFSRLPAELTRKFVGRTGQLLMLVYPAIDTWDRQGAEEFVRQVRSVDAGVTGSPVIGYEASRLMEAAYFHGTLYALVLVTALTLLALRRLRDALIALTPLLLAVLWTIGVMRVLGLPFNLANVWGLPLIVGAASEYGLNVALRFRESAASGRSTLPRSTVVAVLLNGLTNITGFGSLMVARHQGIFGLGLLLTVGAAAGLIASLVVLPLILHRAHASPPTWVDRRPVRKERAMSHRLILMLAVALVLVAASVTDALAGAPTNELRGHIQEVYRTVQGSASAASGDRRADAILDEMFDWPRMAETTLRGHWKTLTPAERKDFTQLFAGVFRRAYVSRIHLVDATKFQYLGDTITGDRATVTTTIRTKRGSTLGVDYAVRLLEGSWRVQDVRVEHVSLVDNYRAQFDAFITRSSYPALVERLRAGAQ